MALKDGGPAFPFTPNPQWNLPDGTWVQAGDVGEPGMSLRDWFAGQVLANPVYIHRSENFQEHAEWAYALADALLKVRAKPGEPHAP